MSLVLHPLGPLLLALVIGLSLWVQAPGLPLDDAWIHLTYARSILESGTLGYNPGDWDNGATAPLWPLLLSLGLGAGLSPDGTGRLASLLSWLALILAGGRLGGRLGGPGFAAAVRWSLALHPWLATLSVSGMETLAASAAGLMALSLLHAARPAQAGLFAALAASLRPELFVLAPCLVLSRRDLRSAARLLGPSGLWGVSWVLYGQWALGHPLPTTFRLKSRPVPDMGDQLGAMLNFFIDLPLLICLPWLIGLVVGGYTLLREERVGPSLLALPSLLLLFFALRVPLPPARGLLSPHSIENLYFGRYLLLLSPFLVLIVLCGLRELHRRALLPSRVLVTLSILWAVGPLQLRRLELAEAWRGACTEINTLQLGLGAWIDQELPADAVIGVSDAGALQYASRQRAVDLVGLNSSGLVDAEDRPAWLKTQGVTHLAVWPDWHRWLREDPRVELRFIAEASVEEARISAGSQLQLWALTWRE